MPRTLPSNLKPDLLNLEEAAAIDSRFRSVLDKSPYLREVIGSHRSSGIGLAHILRAAICDVEEARQREKVRADLERDRKFSVERGARIEYRAAA